MLPRPHDADDPEDAGREEPGAGRGPGPGGRDEPGDAAAVDPPSGAGTVDGNGGTERADDADGTGGADGADGAGRAGSSDGAERAEADHLDAPAADHLWEQRWDELVAQLRPEEPRPRPDDGGPPHAADPRAWAPDPAVEAEEERFVPPDPGPVLTGDPLLTMAWTAVVGAPAVLLLALVLLGRVHPVLAQVAGGAFVVGVAVLVWRMPRDRSDDDGPGAVV